MGSPIEYGLFGMAQLLQNTLYTDMYNNIYNNNIRNSFKTYLFLKIK